jgi:hypothetical protein
MFFSLSLASQNPTSSRIYLSKDLKYQLGRVMLLLKTQVDISI